jgi:UDPglucose 6-dehydrogenase
LIHMANEIGIAPTMLKAIDTVNELQKEVLFSKINDHFKGKLKGLVFAIWGLAFKPRTDDIREAPALVLIDSLLNAGARVQVHDPEAMPNVKALYGDKITYCNKPYDALQGANALAIVTEWQEFRNPNFQFMAGILKENVIFDGRNLYEPKILSSLGFSYYSIGRKTSFPSS